MPFFNRFNRFNPRPRTAGDLPPKFNKILKANLVR
jgi:hypothetical protein